MNWENVAWKDAVWSNIEIEKLVTKNSTIVNGQLKGIKATRFNWHGIWEQIELWNSDLDGDFTGRWHQVSGGNNSNLQWLNIHERSVKKLKQKP